MNLHSDLIIQNLVNLPVTLKWRCRNNKSQRPPVFRQAAQLDRFVELTDAGLIVDVGADQSMLDTLRAAGIDVPSDCEEGLCGTCEVVVEDGDIDHRHKVLTAAGKQANNRMLSCCSRAQGGCSQDHSDLAVLTQCQQYKRHSASFAGPIGPTVVRRPLNEYIARLHEFLVFIQHRVDLALETDRVVQ